MPWGVFTLICGLHEIDVSKTSHEIWHKASKTKTNVLAFRHMSIPGIILRHLLIM